MNEMMQAKTQDWVSRIKKLLAVAEDPNTDDTLAETYREKAYALMTQFEIEEAQLRDTDRTKIENIVRADWKDLRISKTYSYELTHLIASVAEAHGMRGLVGKTWYDHSGKPVSAGVRYPVIIGFEGDVVRLRMLVESLLLQCTTAMEKHMKAWTKDHSDSWYSPSASDKYNERRSFIIGYGSRLAERVREARRVTTAAADYHAPGTALVLVDKVKQVDNWTNENVRVGKGSTRRYGAGEWAGRRAANSADLGQQRFGGSRGAIES